MATVQEPPVNHKDEFDLEMLTAALFALRKGDFTVRLPTTWVGARRQGMRRVQRRDGSTRVENE